MDVSSINSFLQALYLYVPKELVIIILAWFVISICKYYTKIIKDAAKR